MRKFQAKVILVGSSGVGKTSLMSGFVGTQFEATSTPTVAPAFCCRTVALDEGVSVDLQCWDTAGQERFLAISKTYYREANVALVCYAASDAASIATWADRVHEVTPDCRIVAVLTKSDTFSPAEIARDEAHAAAVLARYGADRYVTSARTGEGVAALVEAIAAAALPAPDAQPVVETVAPTVTLGRGGSHRRKCCSSALTFLNGSIGAPPRGDGGGNRRGAGSHGGTGVAMLVEVIAAAALPAPDARPAVEPRA
jgi:small GTP-binding protein